MAVDPHYVRSEFEITATVGGIEFKDVVAFQSTFALNTIPTASLVVATGTQVISGEPATIHTITAQLKPRVPAKVTLTIKTTDGDKEKSPAGTYVIFEGYYSGIGYQRSNTLSNYTIHLMHWLDDLSCSSMINGTWAVGAPHSLATAAAQFSLSAGGQGSGINVAPIIDPSLCSLGNLSGDMWEKTLKPIFQKVSLFSHPSDSGGVTGGNAAALGALQKMPGKAPHPAKLKLNLKGLDGRIVAQSAAAGLTHMSLDGLGYTSFWGKLVGEIAPSFLFAVSPSVEFANVIPYFPPLKKEFISISGDEYNYAAFNANSGALIQCIDIFYPYDTGSGLMVGGITEVQSGMYHPIGRYPKKKPGFNGQIIIKEPPMWLANGVPGAQYSPGTTGMEGPQVGDCANPGKGAAAPVNGLPKIPAVDKNIKTSGVMNRLAEQWFKSEVLSKRYGELSGKLRFDIAPGSSIKVLTPDLTIGNELPMFANVVSVSTVINAEQHTAGTSFSLSHMRTEEENNLEYFAGDLPALYSEAWAGDVLAIKQ